MAKRPGKATKAYQTALDRIKTAGNDARHLSLDGIGLYEIPNETWKLTSIISLHISNNNLTTIDPNISKLTKLDSLYIDNNYLKEIPPEIGKLRNLNSLFLHNNELRVLPPEIGNLSKLRSLGIDGNQLTTLPAALGNLTELTWLSIYDNDLNELPISLKQLTSLKALFLHNNPELQLPESVLGPTWRVWSDTGYDYKNAPKPGPILDYYFRTRNSLDRQPLREGKLILVGRGDVGKTSLVGRLVDNSFDRREDTTQGIRIRPWDVTVGPDEKIRMHVWDFGGQEIMHATHQLFLTDRSLYLLVLDGRAGQQEAEADYWLRLIASFAPESPVLVVLNKIKKDRFDLNRRALREKFPQVQAFFETDCDNGPHDGHPADDGHGIAELGTAIAAQVDQLPEIRQPFPRSWFDIKEALSKPGQKNFLTIDEYRELCVELGESNTESQGNLSLFLHRLGIALNFCDDPRLNDKHVLNPHWLTAGIYRILTSSLLAERKGELRAADLGTLLDAAQYPAEMHGFLLNLMKKFELCFSFDDDRFLIPELLDLQQPEAAEKFDASKCLNFHYRYPVVPPGLLPRFIVRTHVLSEQHRWRTGVILHFEGNTALVKADEQDKTIRVLIDGPVAGRRRMLAMIRQDFDVIHRDIPHLHPDELVSFPKHPVITEKYRDLEVRFAKNPEAVIERVVGDDVVNHTVRELLEGVEFAPLDVALRGPASARSKSHRGTDAERFDLDPREQPVRVFYSYSHEDANPRLSLNKHLSPLERIGLIHGWYDHEILPGAEWEQEIADKMDQAEIILLLISPDFIFSKYCCEIEFLQAVKRKKAKTAEVIPIIIRETNAWQQVAADGVKLGSLNALPQMGKPIPDWGTEDKGWANIAAGIEKIATSVRKNRGTGS